MMETREQLKQAIRNCQHLVALTGAGISTAAGIPDFRGPEGIYASGAYDAEKTFDLRCFKTDPSHFFRFMCDFASLYDGIQPTRAHQYLSDLEDAGILKCVITQNIDGLHQMAGSRNVLELHGSCRHGRCLRCRESYDQEWMLEQLEETDALYCPCGGLVKPDIVFFGEPVRHLMEAQKHALAADLFLVIGSSLSVYPASLLPFFSPAPLAVINRGDVYFPADRIDWHIDADIDKTVGFLEDPP